MDSDEEISPKQHLLGQDGDQNNSLASDEPINYTSLEPQPPSSMYYVIRKRVHDMVEGDIDSYFEYGLLFLILMNVLAFMVGTIEVCESTNNCQDLDEKYFWWFQGFEIFSVVVFTIEYIARIWACVEFEQYAAMGPILGRLRYMVTFFCIIDLISIIPFYITLFPGVPYDLDFATALRGLRLIRLFKADKYINAFSLLGSVFSENSTLLVAAGFYAALSLVIFATLLYFTEKGTDHESAQFFNSIPEALFPVTLMLTGEFPIADFSPWGKFIACLIAVFGVAMFAVPTAVLGSGFIQAIQKAQGREFTVDI